MKFAPSLICFSLIVLAFEVKLHECQAIKCYKCNGCKDLEKAKEIDCASYWYNLDNLPYNTKYSCQTDYENLRNVTKYTLSCVPTEKCTVSTPYYANDGTRKWTKCCT